MKHVRWTHAVIELLGTVPDRVVAERLKCTIAAVRHKRVEFGIPAGGRPGRKPTAWTDEARALLGTVPDRVVADMLGCTITTVRLYRHAHGIPASHDHSGKARVWTPAEDALLGTMIDAKVANRLGLNPLTVRKRRSGLGVKPYGNRDRQWDEAVLRAELSALTTTEFCETYGLSHQRVCQLRQKTGIPSPRRPLPVPATYRSATVLGLTPDGDDYRLRCRCGTEFVAHRLRAPYRYTCGTCPGRGTFINPAALAGTRPNPDGLLTAVRPVAAGSNKRWYFDCDCGTKDFVAFLSNVRRGLTKSCGCLRTAYQAHVAEFGWGPDRVGEWARPLTPDSQKVRMKA